MPVGLVLLLDLLKQLPDALRRREEEEEEEEEEKEEEEEEEAISLKLQSGEVFY